MSDRSKILNDMPLCPFCGRRELKLELDGEVAVCTGCNCTVPYHRWCDRPQEEKLKKALDVLLSAIKFSEDKMLARHIITSRMKDAQKEARIILGLDIKK